MSYKIADNRLIVNDNSGVSRYVALAAAHSVVWPVAYVAWGEAGGEIAWALVAAGGVILPAALVWASLRTGRHPFLARVVIDRARRTIFLRRVGLSGWRTKKFGFEAIEAVRRTPYRELGGQLGARIEIELIDGQRIVALEGDAGRALGDHTTELATFLGARVV